jgi:hypothetical protein
VAESVDIVLVAIRLGYSRRDRFNELRRFLHQNKVDPAGFVITSLERSRGRGTAPFVEDSAAAEREEAASAERAGASTFAARQEG